MKNKLICILCFILIFLECSAFAKKKEETDPLESFVTLDENFTINQAIQYAIDNNPDIMAQKAALLNASSQLHQAKASFDVKTGAEMSYGRNYTPTDAKDLAVCSSGEILYQTVEGQDFTTKAYIEKLFAFGINAKLNYQLSRSKQQYKDGVYAIDPGYASYGSPNYNNNGNFSLDVSVPLLKGFNQAIADNNLKMAKASYESMSFNLEDTVARVIIQTAEAYWKFYIAYEKVQGLDKMVKKNQERVETVNRLVQSRVKNKNEQLRIQVNALSTQRQLETAIIEYMTEKTNLAAQIGIAIEEISDPVFTMPEINTDGYFPDIKDFDRAKMEQIILSRPDMVSLSKACEAAALKVKTAKVDALPDLDLSVSIGTNGTKYGWDAENYFKATTSNIRGLNHTGKIVFSMPIQNNQKKAQIDEANAAYLEALAKFNKQKNTFILQLQNSISALNIYKDTVKNAKSILDSQEEVYENEEKRYDAGLSSIDNLLQQDTEWLNAKITYFQIYETYLKYIMEYKYYTSDLVSIDFNSADLYSLSKTPDTTASTTASTTEEGDTNEK